MTGIDTNILVRFLTQDDPLQNQKAIQIIERRFTERSPGFVSLVTIFEAAWVLEKIYGFSSQEVAEAIEGVLEIESLLVQNEAEVYIAARAVITGLGSFADALIAAIGLWAGCSSTLTFDRKVSRIKGFELVS